jgi:hypothetical protein
MLPRKVKQVAQPASDFLKRPDPELSAGWTSCCTLALNSPGVQSDEGISGFDPK